MSDIQKIIKLKNYVASSQFTHAGTKCVRTNNQKSAFNPRAKEPTALLLQKKTPQNVCARALCSFILLVSYQLNDNEDSKGHNG